ncbi:MAG: c-type cytochrome, partial [Anaerolineae bacterium]|nr:c-type cytochrome [Anaerolineae bacterium]
MHNKRTLQVILGFILVLAVAACDGLAGEPQIVQTLPPITTVPENLDAPVSLSRGAVIYAENCVRCHGSAGAGNGELVLSGDVQNVPDFT